MFHAKPFLITGIIFLLQITGYSISDSLLNRLTISSDFRFRLEQDWNSRRPDGSFRDDRFRARYRFRFGVDFEASEKQTFGFRFRTGFANKQQDPQLTLGDGFGEFNVLPFGFEKIYYQYQSDRFMLWLGKNTFPFEKQNELFWSDNVYPEGAASHYYLNDPNSAKYSIRLTAGHFFIRANNTLSENESLSAFQLLLKNKNERFKVFPGFYYFNNIPNVPDGAGTFKLNYAIAHLGLATKPSSTIPLSLELDLYSNLEDYTSYDSIVQEFTEDKFGVTAAASFGRKKAKGDWFYKLTYTYLEQYSILDIMAQNDWARWDYSAYNSPDGRLSNMQGVEGVISWMISDKAALTVKYYHVLQLRKYGVALETNDRIRFDLDIKF